MAESSAFHELLDQELLALLTDAAAGDASSGSGSGEFNLMRRSTLGLQQLFTEIAASKAFGGGGGCNSSSGAGGSGGSSSGSGSNHAAGGRLTIDTDDASPTVAKRYRLLEQIGEGAFSQIYKALDNYSGAHVAIKVLKTGYDVLGDRETRFLRHFHAKERRCAQHFVHVLGTFRFEQHYCIVQHLYDTTLLHLLHMPDTAKGGTDDGHHSHPAGLGPFRSSVLHQPRVVRADFLRSTGSGVGGGGGGGGGGLWPGMGNNSTISGGGGLGGSSIGGGPDPVVQLRASDITKLKRIATHLLAALCMMRKEGAIHADIKPENCFVLLGDSATATAAPASTSASAPAATAAAAAAVGGAPFHEGLGRLPDAFELRLGDFGNSVHVSEVAQYYADFDMQTLPYRAPEVRHTTHLPSSLVPLVSMPRHLTSRLVPAHLDTQVLLGVPFGCQIDVWSLGVLLVEVCVGKVGFSVPHVGRVCRSVTHAPSPRTLRSPPRLAFGTLLRNAHVAVVRGAVARGALRGLVHQAHAAAPGALRGGHVLRTPRADACSGHRSHRQPRRHRPRRAPRGRGHIVVVVAVRQD